MSPVSIYFPSVRRARSAIVRRGNLCVFLPRTVGKKTHYDGGGGTTAAIFIIVYPPQRRTRRRTPIPADHVCSTCEFLVYYRGRGISRRGGPTGSYAKRRHTRSPSITDTRKLVAHFHPAYPIPRAFFGCSVFYRNASRNHSAFRRNFQTRFQTDHTEAVRYYRLPLARCACSLSRLPRNRRLAKTTSHVRFVIVSRNVRTCTGRPGTNFSVRIAPGASSSSSLSPGRYVRGIRRFSDFCAHRYAARNMCGRIAEGAVVLFISKRQRRNGETLTYVNRQNDMKIKRMRRPRIHEGTTYSRTRLTRRK